MDDKIIDYEGEYRGLLSCVAEQIKMPLVQISSMAGAVEPDNPQDVIQFSRNVTEISNTSIQLIDGFLMSVRLRNQSELALEPVAIGSVMYDVASLVLRYARLTGCEIRLEVSNRCGLVMTNSRIFKSALINLAYSFINANQGVDSKPVRIVADYSRDSVLAGVFSNTSQLSKGLLDDARRLKGSAHQPLNKFSNDNAAGVFVADSLFTNIGSELNLVRYGGGVGLAVKLAPSSQLSLI